MMEEGRCVVNENDNENENKWGCNIERHKDVIRIWQR